MPDKGLINGLGPELNWQAFTPSQPILMYQQQIGQAAPTQPILGTTTVIARYRYDKALGRVSYQGYIQFDASVNFGSGDYTWNILLPIPAIRNLGGTDQLIGSAWASQGTVSNKNMALRPTQSDALGLLNNSNEDYYMQFFLEHMVASGTGAIAGANTSTTITHGMGTTPNANDIMIVPTQKSTNDVQMWWIDTLTSTAFNVNVGTSPGSASFTFAWKAIVEPNGNTVFDLLVNQLRPFGQWANGHVLGWNVEYQARR